MKLDKTQLMLDAFDKIESSNLSENKKRYLEAYVIEKAKVSQLISFLARGTFYTKDLDKNTFLEMFQYISEAPGGAYTAGKEVNKLAGSLASGVAAPFKWAAKGAGKAVTGTAKFGAGFVARPAKFAAKTAAATWLLYRTIGALANKAKRKCGVFGFGLQRNVCMAKVNLDEAKKKLQFLQSQKNKICGNAKDKSKCGATMDASIAKMRATVDKRAKALASLTTKAAQKGKTTSKGMEKATKGSSVRVV